MSSAEPDAAIAGGADAPTEVPQLRVAAFGHGTLLVHRGTGERRLLDGRWQLMEDGQGHGILVPEPGADPRSSRSPMWVSQILALRVSQETRSDGQGLAVTKAGNFIGWVDDLQRSGRQAYVFEGSRSDTDRKFACECVHLHYPPKNCSAVVWWDPSYGLKELLGVPKYDSWVSRKADRFLAVFAEWGMDGEANLRRSLKSMSAKQRKATGDSTPSPQGKFDIESSDRSLLVSTGGLLAILASIGARPKQWRAEQLKDARPTALWIIDSIVARVGKAISGGRFSATAELSLSIMRDGGGSLMCSNITSTSGSLTTWVQKHLCPKGTCTVGELLLALAEARCQKCRISEDKLEILKECFCFMAWWLQQCADLSRDEPFWTEGSFVRLPEIVGPKEARRRLSFDFKQAVSHEVATNGAMRSNAQVVGGLEAVRRPGKRGKDDKQNKKALRRSKNASKFTKDVMVGYLHAGRERNRNHMHANIQLDGSTFSGMDLELFAYWNVERGEGYWLPPMELRHTRLRVGRPGSKFSKQDQNSFQARTLNFFRKRKAQGADGGPGAEKQQRQRKRAKVVPKLATADWLHALHTTLQVGLPLNGLVHFWPEARGADENESDAFRVDQVPLLTIGSDQEAKQRTGVYFLLSKGFSTVLLPPIHHRRNNDLTAAFEASGFAPVLRRCMVKANVAYGPFCSGLFMSDLRDASVDISNNMSSSHPLLMALWPRICRDRGFTTADEVGESGREKFLKDLAASPVASTKGVKCSYKKWMSILDATKFGDKYNGEKMLLLLYLALQRGWISSYDELWDFKSCPKVILNMSKVLDQVRPTPKAKPKAKPKASPRGPAASSSRSASQAAASSASSSSVAVAGDHDGQPAAGEQGGGVADVSRQEAVNTLHVVLRLLANPDEEVKSRIVLLIGRAVRKAHQRDIKDVRSVEGVRNYYVDMANWGFMTEILGCLEPMDDLCALARLGMVANFPPSLKSLPLADPQVVSDDAVAAMVWRLTRGILKHRALSMLWHVSCCVGVWAGFLAGSAEQKAEAMSNFKGLWESYLECKQSRSPDMVDAANRHSCNCRAAQDMARLCKSSNWVVDQRIVARARLIFEGVGQENMLENAMKFLREVEVKQGTSKKNRTFRYWEAAHQGGLFATNERKEVVPDGNHVPVPDAMLDNIFQPWCGSDSGLPFNEVMKATFYSPNTKSERESWVQVELLRYLKARDQMNLISDAWVSGLLPEGEFCDIISDDGEHDVFLSVAVTRYGVVGLKAQRVCSNFIRISPEAKRLTFHFAFDPKRCKVVSTAAASPLKVFLKDSAPQRKIACMVEILGKPQKLLEWQSEHGFCSVSEDLLKSLSSHLDMPADVMTGVTDADETDPKLSLALACMRHVEPALPESDAFTRLRTAMCGDPDTLGVKDTSNADAELFGDEVLEDVLEKDDRKVIRDARKSEEKVAECIKKKRAVLRTIVTQSYLAKVVSNGGKKAAAKTKSVTASEMDRWWNVTKGDGRFIVKYLPPSAKHFTDNVNGRFLLMQHSLGYDRKSFSWTKRGNQKASLMLLQVAWQRHCDAHDVECPLPEVLFENHEL